MTRNFLILCSLIALLCLAACAPQRRQMSIAEVELLSQQYGYSQQIRTGGNFSLLTVSADVTPVVHDNVLRVYIEGDGLAWLTRRHLSDNPTPVNPLALRLMLADPFTDKLYIARPCQFVQTEACNPRFWSTDRYNTDVIRAVGAVLTQFKQAHDYTQIELIGYSGGATVALLLAAERDDVKSIRTVSGNLDPAEFCRLHHLTPLIGSLNPINYAASLQHIPQLHFVGSVDPIVPIDIFNSYINNFTDVQHIKVQVVSGVGHRDGWVKQWGTLLKQPL